MPLASEVESFLLCHVLIVHGTRDESFSPEFGRGFGVRIDPGGDTVETLVLRRQWPATIANIAANGAMAVTASVPETYCTYQLKGRATMRPANKADCLLAKPTPTGLSDLLSNLGIAWVVIHLVLENPKSRLVDQDQAPDRRPQARSRLVQS